MYSLPIHKSAERMQLNKEYSKYFENKTIYYDLEYGCYTIEQNRKIFCCNDIYTLSVADGFKETPKNFDSFVKKNCSEEVIKYYFTCYLFLFFQCLSKFS